MNQLFFAKGYQRKPYAADIATVNPQYVVHAADLQEDLAQLAAARWILQRLPRYPNHLVVALLDAAQVDVLDGIVRLRHFPRAARAVDDGTFHRGDHRFLVADVALHLVQRLREQLAGVVALHRIDVRLDLVRFRIG